MNDRRELLDAVEYLNKEYILLQNSKEYLIGKKISKTLYYIKHFQFLKLLRDIYNSIRIKKYLKFQSVSNSNMIYKDNYVVSSSNNKKIVVYTCITGNYDKIQDPFMLEENVEYVLFTNNKSIKSDIWDVREIPENILNLNDNTLINRYIKMHPFELFYDYDYAIYLDGNIKIMSEISSLIDFINEESGLAFHQHKARNCIYDEIDACLYMNKGNKNQLKKFKEKIMNDNFPKDFGLLECGLFVVNLNNNNSKIILDNWWNSFIETGCYRDQIMFPYSLWNGNYKISCIGIIGKNIYRNMKIRIMKHN